MRIRREQLKATRETQRHGELHKLFTEAMPKKAEYKKPLAQLRAERRRREFMMDTSNKGAAPTLSRFKRLRGLSR